jgi:hypothetical protein
MIIRILTEGQYDVPEAEMDGLNILDEELEAAIEAENETRFRDALGRLLDRVRSAGKEVAPDVLVPSDLVLPFSDATIEEVRDLLGEEGLIPGRSASAAATEA